MKKAVMVALVLAVAIALFAGGCTTDGAGKYNHDIFESQDDFNFTNLDKLQEDGWGLSSGGTNSDVFSLIENDGVNALRVNTSTAGYASVTRKLFLKPFSYYRISYSYTSTSMSALDTDKGYVGLYVGFSEDPSFNLRSDKPTEERTSNSNGRAYFYFKTNGEREVTLSINVGTEDNPVSVSSVILRGISLERVHRTDVNDDASYPCYSLHSAIYGAPSVLNVVFVVLGAVGTIVIGYAVYMLLARIKAWQEGGTTPSALNVFEEKKWLAPLIVCGAAALIRLLITLIESGISGANSVTTVYYGYDLEQLAKQGVWLANYGTPYFYRYFESALTLPVPMYLSMIAGLFGRLIGLIPGATDATITLTTVSVLKLFAVFADIGTVLLIYNEASKRWSRMSAGVIALAYAVMPVAFSVSAGWGAMESITVFFIVLTFSRLARNDYFGSTAAYFAAAMTSTPALYISPFLLIHAGYRIYKGIREKNHFKWISVILVSGGALLLYFLITLPYTVFQIGDGNGAIAFDNFIAATQSGQLYTMNAFNFQALLGNNFKEITTEFLLVAILFVLFIIGVLAAVTFRNRPATGRAPKYFELLVFSAGFVLLYYSIICVATTQTSFLIALPLLLIAAAYAKDKRIYAVFVLFGTLAFINTSYVYTVAGYTDAGVTQIGYDTPLLYIMGAIQLLAIIYAAYVLYDVVINRKVSEILSLRVSYLGYVKGRATNAAIVISNGWNRVKAFCQSVWEAMKKEKDKAPEEDKKEE